MASNMESPWIRYRLSTSTGASTYDTLEEAQKWGQKSLENATYSSDPKKNAWYRIDEIRTTTIEVVGR